MKYKAIIFDLDGVICSTDEYHYMAWKAMADKKGIEFDKVINNRLRGVSRMESLEIILEKYNGEPLTFAQKIEMAEEKNELYKTFLEKMSPSDVSDEVLSTLNTLRKEGIKLAIGSSSKNAKYILKRIGLGDFFDAISDGNNISKSKPDPEVFLIAAQMVGFKPCECLVIEDAVAGVIAANNGGFDCGAIGDARTHKTADYSLTTFKDILKIAI